MIPITPLLYRSVPDVLTEHVLQLGEGVAEEARLSTLGTG